MKMIVGLMSLWLVWGMKEEQFEIKHSDVGENVTLSCVRDRSDYQSDLFWIRFVNGSLPDVLGVTSSFDSSLITKSSHIRCEQGPGTFLLRLLKVTPRDTGFYYCIKTSFLTMVFLKRTFLRIQGTEPEVKAVLQLRPSESLRSVTLQCSVLSDSENTPCPRVRNVCWFQSGPDASHPSVLAVLDGSLGGCEDGVKGHSPQKCGSKVSEEISSSHTETFSCVVAACGEVFFGKLNHRHAGTFNSTNICIVLLAVALAASVIVNACLVYLLNSKSSGCCKPAVVGSTGDEETQPREEEVCYAAPVFTRRKAQLDRGHIREKETVYADVATEN